MARVGYHISHEQFAPSHLLDLAILAEKNGFEFCLSSDHFHPWNREQGQSGFAWSWLGAAMARTQIKYGVVTCPAYRYHPAVIAQAAATLDEMFPGRFWICPGSGQALNEAITGEKWPEKPERNARLMESVEVMRALWKGDKVTHNGHVRVEEAKLYTRPRKEIPVIAAAITPETAAWAASWADGLLTVSQEMEKLSEVVKAWRSNGGADKPMMIKVQLSYHKNEKKAEEEGFEQWRTNLLGPGKQGELRSPEQFEKAAQDLEPKDMKGSVIVSDDPEILVRRIKDYIALGFRDLSLHNVNTAQEDFIKVFGKEVLPELKKA
jgi:coenzyme F420-dependent glucose-6-phosphate dehydrogenase